MRCRLAVIVAMICAGMALAALGMNAWQDQLLPGDILLCRTPGSPVMLWEQVPGTRDVLWTHVGVYVGDGFVIEATPPDEHSDFGVRETPLAMWMSKSTVGAFRVRHADGTDLSAEEIEEVIQFLRDQVDKDYCLIGIPSLEHCSGAYGLPCTDHLWPCFFKRLDSETWYCSELAWAAYKSIGIDIEEASDYWAVFPDEIARSPLTELIGGQGLSEVSLDALRQHPGAASYAASSTASDVAAAKGGFPVRMVMTGVPLVAMTSNVQQQLRGEAIGCGPIAALKLLGYYAAVRGYSRLIEPDPTAVLIELHEKMHTTPILDQAFTLPSDFYRGLASFIQEEARYPDGATFGGMSGTLQETFDKAVQLIRSHTIPILLYDYDNTFLDLPIPSHYAIVVGYRMDGGRRELIVDQGWGEEYRFSVVDMTDVGIAPVSLLWIDQIASEELRPADVSFLAETEALRWRPYTWSLDASGQRQLNVCLAPTGECWPSSSASVPVGLPGSSEEYRACSWNVEDLGLQTTILCIDVSGSMSDPDQSGIGKLEAAKKAAANVVHLVQAERALGISHDLGLIAFSSAAEMLAEPQSSVETLLAQIRALQPGGGTNIGAALVAANAQLAEIEGSGSILVLTDGETNEGLSKTEVLDGPAADAAVSGTCIYTIGFGEPARGSLDWAFLESLARATPCSKSYDVAADAIDLGQAFLRDYLRSIKNDIRLDLMGRISESQVLEMGTFLVSAYTRIRASLHWPGSLLELELWDPRGVLVTPEYQGAAVLQEAGYVQVTVSHAMPGEWSAMVRGVDVPEAETKFGVIIGVESDREVLSASWQTDGLLLTYNLPQEVRWAKAILADTAGQWVAETTIDPRGTRYPVSGYWIPSTITDSQRERLQEEGCLIVIWTEMGFHASTQVYTMP